MGKGKPLSPSYFLSSISSLSLRLGVFVYPACPVASENGTGVGPEDLSASGGWYMGVFNRGVQYFPLFYYVTTSPFMHWD